MARVRRIDTPAELAVRSALHSVGVRFRVRNSDLPGKPDLANRKRGWVIFVHGCFWHRHRGCPRATIPVHNRPLWERKFARNVARDRRVRRALNRLGFRCFTVWECDALRHTDQVVRRLLVGIAAI